MKRKIIILVIVVLLLSSCGAQTVTQLSEIVTEMPVTKAPAMPATVEPAATPKATVVEIEEFVATQPPTEVPTEPSLICVTLLEPINGMVLPVTGKVTFSWTPMNEAGIYVLNFILPSGAIASFETDQTFRDRYMEAFASGGEYQWQVIAKDTSGSNICISEIATFMKPAYEKPKSDRDHGGNSEAEGVATPPPAETGGPD